MKIYVHGCGTVGGAERVMLKVAEVLTELKEKYDLYLICSYVGDVPCVSCDEMITLPMLNGLGSINELAQKLATLRKYRDVDIIFAHTSLLPVKKPVKVIIDGRDWDKFFKFYLNWRGKLLNYPLKKIRDLYVSMPNTLILLLNKNSFQYYGRRNSNIRHISNGIDDDVKKLYQRKFRRRWDFIYVGRFSEEKNPQLVIDTFKDKPYRGLMVGADKEYTVVGNIVVKAFSPRKDVLRMMKESKVLILPSRHEVFPLVLLEALALGVPSIVSDSIQTEISRYTIPFRCCDKRDLYETFLYVMENYPYYEKRYRKISRLILKKYDWDEILKKSSYYNFGNLQVREK